MATMALGAPLLAGGPPGWVAYAALGVGTLIVGAVAYSSVPRAEPQTRTRDRADTTCANCRPYSTVCHAQGTDMGGTSGSTLGAPPIVQMSPITVGQGTAQVHATYAMLGRRQQAVRAQPLARALQWLSSRPQNGGYLGQKSFEARGVPGGVRLDIDSYGPSPNFIA